MADSFWQFASQWGPGRGKCYIFNAGRVDVSNIAIHRNLCVGVVFEERNLFRTGGRKLGNLRRSRMALQTAERW